VKQRQLGSEKKPRATTRPASTAESATSPRRKTPKGDSNAVRELARTLFQVTEAFRVMIGQVFADQGARFQQHLILSLIEDNDGTLPLTELVRRMDTSKSTASFHLQRMEAAGLITREVLAEDRRAFTIRATRAGNALRTRLNQALERFMVSFAGQLAPDEIEVVSRGLATLLLRVDLLHETARQAGVKQLRSRK
jgi:DNA-binding MarR family transcriptional regulator